jgi:hypothetical protein
MEHRCCIYMKLCCKIFLCIVGVLGCYFSVAVVLFLYLGFLVVFVVLYNIENTTHAGCITILKKILR